MVGGGAERGGWHGDVSPTTIFIFSRGWPTGPPLPVKSTAHSPVRCAAPVCGVRSKCRHSLHRVPRVEIFTDRAEGGPRRDGQLNQAPETCCF